MDICPLCDSASTAVVYEVDLPLKTWTKGLSETGSLRLSMCQNCGHLWNAAHEVGQDTIIYRDQPLSNKPVTAGMMHRYQAVLDFIGDANLRGKSIVEIGAGAGDVARKLAALGDHVTLFEPNQNLTSTASNMTVINGFFEPTVMADIIIARQVMAHVPDPIAMLRGIADTLRPGGLAYLEVPNGAEVADAGLWHDIHHPHVHYYRPQTFIAACARFGLRAEKITYIMDNHDFGVLLSRDGDLQAEEAPPTVIQVGDRLDRAKTAYLDFVQQAPFGLFGATAVSVPMANAGPRPSIVYDDNEELWSWQTPRLVDDPIDISAPTHFPIKRIAIAAYLHADPIVRRLRENGFEGEIFDPRQGAHNTV